jgi:hypothetical protein
MGLFFDQTLVELKEGDSNMGIFIILTLFQYICFVSATLAVQPASIYYTFAEIIGIERYFADSSKYKARFVTKLIWHFAEFIYFLVVSRTIMSDIRDTSLFGFVVTFYISFSLYVTSSFLQLCCYSIATESTVSN